MYIILNIYTYICISTQLCVMSVVMCNNVL